MIASISAGVSASVAWIGASVAIETGRPLLAGTLAAVGTVLVGVVLRDATSARR